MLYISTSGKDKTDLRGAVKCCYAPDGGIYLPERLPVIPRAYFNNIAEMSLTEIAYVVANMLLGDEIDAGTIKSVVDRAFDFDIPLRQLPSGVHVLELFNGPTHAFKDISARFMSALLQTHARISGVHPVVLTATTGNTGEAIADAFAGIEGVDTVVLYPQGAMSRSELSRFAAMGAGVHVVEVAGTIDQCKTMVRQVVTEHNATGKIRLLTANTHNVVRLLPQIVYFFHACARLAAAGHRPDGFSVAIPCGNLSNLTSAVMARRMGLPMGRIVAGCSANNGFARVLDGTLAPGDVSHISARTLARAMDSGYPTNLPRLLALYKGDLQAMRRDISAASVSDEQIRDTIRHADMAESYLLDPHTAVAYAALRSIPDSGTHEVVLATAHPAKSAATVSQILGREIEPLPMPACCNGAHAPRTAKTAPTAAALNRYIQTHIKP
ncbi:MAG: threonine synthase [Bacteroidales bacterium]|nr:threonine synthase [Bacteroidales bacterium]